MSAKNVPNKIEKENIFGNMILEFGLTSENEEKIVNRKHSINNEIPKVEIEKQKETNFPHTKFKKHKNHIKQKLESSGAHKLRPKSSLYLRRDLKGIKGKNNQINKDSQKVSMNNKNGSSNSRFNNHENENKNIINNNSCLITDEKNEDINKNIKNIENSPNKENISNNNETSLNNLDTEMKNEEIIKPSLTWNTVNAPDSPFVPMEYINDIWDSFIEKEKLNYYSYDGIVKIQMDIKESMRSILIDWLISLQNKFFFNIKTLFLTVNLIDRYLSKKHIHRTRFQLLGVAALFIASKYEEMYTKNLSDYVEITARAFNKNQILEMESELIDVVDFNLDLPLSIDFLGLLGAIYKFDKMEFRLSYFLLEAYLLTLNSTKYKQSQISLAVCYIILGLRKMNYICPNQEGNFIKYFSKFYNINFEIWNQCSLIIECGKNVYSFYEKKEQVIYKEVYYIFNDLFT